MSRLLAAMASLALVGCTSVLASPAEYGAFRATRAAPTLADRLVASESYLAAYPEGAFAVDVRARFNRAELLFFASKSDSMVGLEVYLHVLPNGPHAEEAARRLDAKRLDRARNERIGVLAAATEARLARMKAERARVPATISFWVEKFADASAFTRPVAQAKADLVVAWSLALPRPECVTSEADGHARRRCEKTLTLDYTVVDRRKADARQATIAIVVDEDEHGTPTRAVVGGPDLFTRLEETVAVRAFAPGDSDARIAGIAEAVRLVDQAFERAVPNHGPACNRPVVAPVVLERACGGVHLIVQAAANEGEEDRTTIEPR